MTGSGPTDATREARPDGGLPVRGWRGDWPGLRELPGLLASVVLVNLVGAAPVLLAGPDSAWFRSLTLPAFYPPTWAFGVVWTLLFTLLGVVLYLLYRQGIDRHPVRVAIGAFLAQMALNVAWTPAFFALESPAAGLLVIVTLWFAVVIAIVTARQVDRRAAVLYLPYLLWVSFATVLNAAIWQLNP